MKNKEKVIIYIGKSKNLKSRVSSYFVPGASLNFAKKKMIGQINHIDYIETKSDLEALILETNLIKQHQPKYNVLMKDGKNLSYIKITADEIPCLVRTRIKANHGEYFGPYSQYFDVYNYVRFLRKLFKLGNHEKIERFGPPCMDTYIGLCPGHCTGEEDKIDLYLERLGQARDFLMGHQEKILAELREKMQNSANKRDFESAANYKDKISQIESAGNTQIVRDAIEGDAIVMVSLEKYDRVFLGIIEVHTGMIIAVHEHTIENPLGEDTSVLINEAILQYLARHPTPVLYTDISLSKDTEKWLSSQKIKLKRPARGEKVRVLEFAHTNLLNFAYRETMDSLKSATLSKGTMMDLLNIVNKQCTETAHTKDKKNSKTKSGVGATNYVVQNKKEIIFECFDISHSHGEHTVASKSVLVNGKPEPKRYRKYRIKTLKTGEIDDFASMEEILTRRALGALRGEDPWPDLIIIDGGKGQLSHALGAIQEVTKRWDNENTESSTPTIAPPPVISLAKRIEEVFVPGRSEAILLEKGSPELMLLQKIRDEAHRFAINYNRSSREKSYTKTILDEIPGIGPSTRKKILRSVSRIEELSSWSYEKAKKEFGKIAADALENHALIGQ